MKQLITDFISDNFTPPPAKVLIKRMLAGKELNS